MPALLGLVPAGWQLVRQSTQGKPKPKGRRCAVCNVLAAARAPTGADFYWSFTLVVTERNHALGVGSSAIGWDMGDETCQFSCLFHGFMADQVTTELAPQAVSRPSSLAIDDCR